jgi:putative tricarboxylic transport membrane protein
MLEEHFRRAMILSRGDPTIFFERPISAVLLAISAGILIFAVLPFIRRKREEIFVEDTD